MWNVADGKNENRRKSWVIIYKVEKPRFRWWVLEWCFREKSCKKFKLS